MAYWIKVLLREYVDIDIMIFNIYKKNSFYIICFLLTDLVIESNENASVLNLVNTKDADEPPTHPYNHTFFSVLTCPCIVIL